MADWSWYVHPEDLLDGLPDQVVAEVKQFAKELATRDSMVYLDGHAYTGPSPGVRTEATDSFIITYLTDVRAECVAILKVI